MRVIIVLLLWLPALSFAQGSGSADAGSGSAAPPPAPTTPPPPADDELAKLQQEVTKRLAEVTDPKEQEELGRWLAELQQTEKIVGELKRRATELKQPELQAYLEDAAGSLRKVCVAAISADYAVKPNPFADQVVRVAEVKLKDRVAVEQICKDATTLKAHEDAQAVVATNQRHVIMAYAAMWLIAVGFVLFLWRRQQTLKQEIAHLRRDLDAAAKDGS